VNGTLAVARYTLIELSRRRILLVLTVIGALGIAAIGGAFKIVASVNPASISFGGGPGSGPIDPAKLDRVNELQFVIQLIGVIGFFAVLIAFAIGMTAIYHDLESGAAVGISLEMRLVMALFGGGLEGALWVETVAAVANGLLVMLIVLLLTTWMNNIIAAVVAFVYNIVIANVVVSLHDSLVAGFLGDNAFLNGAVNVAYWLVPHHLMSDAQRQLALAEGQLFAAAEGSGGATPADFVRGVPGASDLQDIIWWAFLVVLAAALVYFAVRRRQV
jgi:hypothetical protein